LVVVVESRRPAAGRFRGPLSLHRFKWSQREEEKDDDDADSDCFDVLLLLLLPLLLMPSARIAWWRLAI
jgi:hypothetical protein